MDWKEGVRLCKHVWLSLLLPTLPRTNGQKPDVPGWHGMQQEPAAAGSTVRSLLLSETHLGVGGVGILACSQQPCHLGSITPHSGLVQRVLAALWRHGGRCRKLAVQQRGMMEWQLRTLGHSAVATAAARA